MVELAFGPQIVHNVRDGFRNIYLLNAESRDD
jgi:hypothetical protein